MDKLKQYKIQVKEEDLISESVMKNVSQLAINKNGIGITYDVAGQNVTVICDKELPAVFILARISELLESKEKEIKERM